jgi:hypothetical protein
MKQMYRESEQFYLQHRGKTIFFQWVMKARHKRRLMTIVNERFTRTQRNTLRYRLFISKINAAWGNDIYFFLQK